MSEAPYRRILLTGGIGNLGSSLRPHLTELCQTLRVADRVDPGPARGGEEVRTVALEDREGMLALLEGVDAVVHFGGVMKEDWELLLAGNVVGLQHLYEAARIQGVKRIVQASSNHATGFYPAGQVISPADPPRPDCLYGSTKVWGEALARLYFDRYGIESACLRIGSAFPEPRGRRMLSTWLSYGDLARLVRSCLLAPKVGYSVVYGVSDNRDVWWDNSSAAHLGYKPEDSSEPFRAAIEAANPPLPPDDPDVLYQGGRFVAVMDETRSDRDCN